MYMIKKLSVICLALLFSITALAESDKSDKNKFSIEYAEKSPIKEVPLKNATLKIRVWYNGNPSGDMEVSTDENQNFTLDQFKDPSAVALQILSITDQEKYNARCQNTEDSGDKRQIMVFCKKV